METTIAATPKARLAVESPLAFPVPPPPGTARMMPTFAFPRPSDPHAPTRRANASVSDGLAGLAALIESAPLPALPDSAWAFIGRAWFFIAGTTMGILLAFALIAAAGPKRASAREGHAVMAQGTARVLVVERAPTAAERGIGALAENDLDEVAPAPPVVRRTTTVVRRPPMRRPAAGGKDLLNAGL